MRTSVVLPAPLGPSSPNTVPGVDLEVEAVERDHVAEAPCPARGRRWRGSCGTPPDRDVAVAACGRAPRPSPRRQRAGPPARARCARGRSACRGRARRRCRRGCRPRASPSAVSRDDRPALDLAQADVAVGGLGRDRGARAVDGDAAVGRAAREVAGDVADPGVAVGVLDHRDAVELAPARTVARAGRDLGVAGRAVDDDVADAGLEVDGGRPRRPGSSPTPVLMRQSPSGPCSAKSVIWPAPRTCEPAGSSIVTSIDPPSLRREPRAQLRAP